MASDEPLPDRCAAQTRSGGYCEKHSSAGRDRCRFHGGHSPGPESNSRNLQHGATASHETLLEHLDEGNLEWIEELAIAYWDLAGLEPDDPRCDLIMDAAVSSYQCWAARSEAIASDLTTERLVAVDDNGHSVRVSDEHLPLWNGRPPIRRDTADAQGRRCSRRRQRAGLCKECRPSIYDELGCYAKYGRLRIRGERPTRQGR